MVDVATLDTESLQHWLEKSLPGFRGPLEAEKFSGGQSNPTFLLTSPTGQWVLRRKPPGQLLASAHAVDREYRVLEALANTGVPVAQAICLCEDTSVIGSMFYLMSYESGRIFWDPALPELARPARADIYRELVRVLARLHEVRPEQVGLADYGRPGNYFERQLSRWIKQYRASETEPMPAMEMMMAWLPTAMPEDDGQVSLIHGDYRLDNFIFDTSAPRIRAVLDWELSTLGHPFADLAYLCMCLRLPASGFPKGLAGLDRQALGVPDEQALVEDYCAQRGLSGVPHWRFYLVFSFFRLAAICQGVLRRALDGNASSEKALETGRQASVLAAMGAALISADD